MDTSTLKVTEQLPTRLCPSAHLQLAAAHQALCGRSAGLGALSCRHACRTLLLRGGVDYRAVLLGRRKRHRLPWLEVLSRGPERGLDGLARLLRQLLPTVLGVPLPVPVVRPLPVPGMRMLRRRALCMLLLHAPAVALWSVRSWLGPCMRPGLLVLSVRLVRGRSGAAAASQPSWLATLCRLPAVRAAALAVAARVAPVVALLGPWAGTELPARPSRAPDVLRGTAVGAWTQRSCRWLRTVLPLLLHAANSVTPSRIAHCGSAICWDCFARSACFETKPARARRGCTGLFGRPWSYCEAG